MASLINADNGVVSGSAGVKTTADSSGVLALQTNGTTALSISTAQVVSFTNSPTYTAGTANGVAYLNGSKVLTTGSALTFDGTTFTSTGSQGLLNTVGGNTARMVATAAGAYFGSTTAADVIFQYNSTEGMRLTSTGLGIGTSSPSNPLTVTSDTSAQVRIGTVSANINARITLAASGTGINVLGSNGTAALAFYSGATEQMRIDTSGKLGIGTSSPTSTVDVFGLQANTGASSASSPTGTMRLAYAGGAGSYGASLVFSQYWYSLSTTQIAVGQITGIKTAGDGNFGGGLAFFYGASGANALSEGIRLTDSGSVGIGTGSPGARISVENASGITGLFRNTTATSYTSLRLYNDQNSSTRSLEIDYSGSTYSGALITGGPSGEQGAVGTTGAYPLVLYTSNTARAVIDSSGNLGIGTASPAQLVNARKDQTAYTWMRVENQSSSASAYAGLMMGAYGNSWGLAVGSSAANSNALTFVLDAGGTNSEKMRLDTSGNLGLGVTPSAWDSGFKAIDVAAMSAFTGSATGTDVWNNTRVTGGSAIYKTTAAASFYRQFTGQHVWYNAASGTAGNAITFTQAMTLDASGNLLVGTTSNTNSYRAVIAGDVAFFTSNDTAGSTTLRLGSSLSMPQGIAVVAGVKTAAGTGYLTFATADSGVGPTERARIDSSGNLLVGTTDTGETTGVGLKLITTSSKPSFKVVTSASTNTSGSFFAYSTGAAAYRFYVDDGGTIHATSTSIAAISDQSLKTNVRDIETGLSQIMALKPRRFDWINGDAVDVAGFVAQEVQQVLPDLVGSFKYNDTETKLGLKMGDMIPTMVKAMQEQQALIESLTARLNSLENK